jgi:membrane fusion protein (multidrug efflux system)
MTRRGLIGSFLLLAAIGGIAVALAKWKDESLKKTAAAAASQPEPMESVTVATAKPREFRRTTTSIGTVMALRSIALKNELAGTIRDVKLVPGQIVDEGTVLVALDVAVEEAELKAQEAQAALSETMLGRLQRASQNRAASETEVDRARSERDVALAQIARTKAIIARKTIRAPFRARVGMNDLHVGQYLNEGALLTTLQGVDDAVHVDFTVSQRVAAGLHEGERVEVLTSSEAPPIPATVVALDARVDPMTRNAMVRAKMEGPNLPTPGASVRVRTPVGPPRNTLSVPVSALRRGPAGNHVFAIVEKDGKTRAQLRQIVSGEMLGDEVLIYSGLSAGERIAASGSFKLRDGVLVAIMGDAASRPDGDAPGNGGR